MPKSKRAKVVTLSKTQKKGHARKATIIDEVRACADKYKSAYVLTAHNMRNTALKDVRAKLASSRIFFGRTKLLTAALGRDAASEHRDGLSKVAGALHGQGEAGLLFSDETFETVQRVLEEGQTEEFARAGTEATETVELPAGALHQFPHNMEPYLRKLGMPTRLNNGTVTLLALHTVCEEGDTLTSDQAKILQLLGNKMATFRLTMRCRWTEGEFELFEDDDE